MKCNKDGKTMKFIKGIKFNEYSIDGWKCSCGEIYYDPAGTKSAAVEQTKKEVLKAKLGKIRSNLILRLPKDLEHAFSLEKGENVLIEVEGNGFKVVPA